MEVETGTISTAGGVITFTPKRATCPGPIKPYSLGYRLEGGYLNLTGESGGFVMGRVTRSSAGTSVNGCYDNAGVFVQAPLADVSN